MRICVETTVTRANCRCALASHVLALAPARWTVIRGQFTSLQHYMDFLDVNYRAAAEMDNVVLEWGLRRVGNDIV